MMLKDKVAVIYGAGGAIGVASRQVVEKPSPSSRSHAIAESNSF
jgi:hypothetical protein